MEIDVLPSSIYEIANSLAEEQFSKKFELTSQFHLVFWLNSPIDLFIGSKTEKIGLFIFYDF